MIPMGRVIIYSSEFMSTVKKCFERYVSTLSELPITSYQWYLGSDYVSSFDRRGVENVVSRLLYLLLKYIQS